MNPKNVNGESRHTLLDSKRTSLSMKLLIRVYCATNANLLYKDIVFGQVLVGDLVDWSLYLAILGEKFMDLDR